MKLRAHTLGGRLGVVFCLAGLVLIWAGWNGAASYNDIRRQFPYLISGGVAGLALVVIGAGLFVVQSLRADRVQLEANLVELRAILERLTLAPAGNGSEARGVAEGAPLVVAGPTTYHRPECRLVEGRDGLRTMSVEAAESAGLSPCRTCAPGGEEAATPVHRSLSRRRPGAAPASG